MSTAEKEKLATEQNPSGGKARKAKNSCQEVRDEEEQVTTAVQASDQAQQLRGMAEKLSLEIQGMSNYKQLYSEIQRIVASSAVRKDDFKNTLLEALKREGLETELRNTVFHWMRSQRLDEPKEQANVYGADLSYLKKAQMQWERRIQKSLNSMCNELNIPLARLRSAADRDELAEKWNELSTCDFDLGQYRPLFAPKDFLEVLFSLRDPTFKKQPNELNWEFSHIQIKVKTLAQLRDVYEELSRGEPLLGVNGNVPSGLAHCPNFEAERIHLGEKVLKANHAPVAQEFLKRGCPRALRGRLWSLVLGSVVRDADAEYYDELKAMVLQYDIMVDKLIIKDVQLTASNDDQYFVFEDLLYKTMLSFSRDSEVLPSVTRDRCAGGQVIHAVLQGKPATLDNTLVFPPSGVIPFHGFTMYATPFCYLYDEPCAIYFAFRAFYLRYWFRLHTVSSHEQGIVAVCLCFERLLQCHEPELWAHFRNLHIPPVKVVFKWLMRGFSGHLPPEQLLYLWDLVLAYDSLEIVALLAATILSFRKDNLMQVNTVHNVEAVLADLSSIKVMPLLQLSLLRD